MHTRLPFWDEDEVRKKKTLILVLAFLLVPLLLGLYAAIGPEGGLIAGMTPTALPVSTPTDTATPTASAAPAAKATVTPVPPEPTATPTAGPVALEPTPTPTVAPPVLTSTAASTVTPVPPEPMPTPTVIPMTPLTAPVITTPSDGSVFKDDRPTIAGSAPPNATVQVYDDGSLVGTTAADAQGDWALVADEPLEPGEHTVTAVASDNAGGTSAPSVAVIFTVIIERLPVTGGSGFERWLEKLLPAAFP